MADVDFVVVWEIKNDHGWRGFFTDKRVAESFAELYNQPVPGTSPEKCYGCDHEPGLHLDSCKWAKDVEARRKVRFKVVERKAVEVSYEGSPGCSAGTDYYLLAEPEPIPIDSAIGPDGKEVSLEEQRKQALAKLTPHDRALLGVG